MSRELVMTSGGEGTGQSVISGLFLYTFGFAGLALGGQATVIARSEEEARSQFQTPLGDVAELTETRVFTVPCVAAFDNGDY